MPVAKQSRPFSNNTGYTGEIIGYFAISSYGIKKKKPVEFANEQLLFLNIQHFKHVSNVLSGYHHRHYHPRHYHNQSSSSLASRPQNIVTWVFNDTDVYC